MTAQDLKLLLSNRLINAAAVAVLVFPNLKENSAKKTFLMKLNGAQYYTLTEQDQTNAAEVLRTFAAELKRTNAAESSILTILSNPILKRSAIAEQLYKDFTPKAAAGNFANKLNGAQNRSFSESERVQIAAILHDLGRTIEASFEIPVQTDGGAKTLAEILNGGKIDPNIFAPKKSSAGQDY